MVRLSSPGRLAIVGVAIVGAATSGVAIVGAATSGVAIVGALTAGAAPGIAATVAIGGVIGAGAVTEAAPPTGDIMPITVRFWSAGRGGLAACAAGARRASLITPERGVPHAAQNCASSTFAVSQVLQVLATSDGLRSSASGRSAQAVVGGRDAVDDSDSRSPEQFLRWGRRGATSF